MGCSVWGSVVGGEAVGGWEGRCEVCPGGCAMLGGLVVGRCVSGICVCFAIGMCVWGWGVLGAEVVMWWREVGGDVLL